MGFGMFSINLWINCLLMSIELNVASMSSSSLILSFSMVNESLVPFCLFEFMPIALYSISINHCPDIVFNLSTLICNSPTMLWSVIFFGYATTVVIGEGHFVTTKSNSSSASIPLQWKVEMQSSRMSGYSARVLVLLTSGNISQVLPMDGCFHSV